MIYDSQEDHKKYIQEMEDQGFPLIETTPWYPKEDCELGKNKAFLSKVPDPILEYFKCIKKPSNLAYMRMKRYEEGNDTGNEEKRKEGLE